MGGTLPGHLSRPSRRRWAPHAALSLPVWHYLDIRAPAQSHTWAQAHEQKMQCSSNSHVSRFGVSSSWAGYPGGPVAVGPVVVVVVGVWGWVGRGS